MDDINRLIGQIEAGQSSAKDAMLEVRLALAEHKRDSNEGRTRLYQAIAATDQRIVGLSHEMSKITDRLNNLDVKMSKIDEWQQKLAGAKMAVWGIAAATGAILATLGKWITVKLGWS